MAPAAKTSASRWAPPLGSPWQIQYTGTLSIPAGVVVADIDGADTSAATVASLHQRGVSAVCYFNAGAWEDWRADAGAFPASLKGKALDGWPGEVWLDVRRTDVLLPIMARRMDDCARKGFDAVDPDNVDGWTQNSGFAISANDQLGYLRALSNLAHQRGLAIGLKNNVEQIPALAQSFDFAVNEECLTNNECAAYEPFLAARKLVLHVEYAGTIADICARRPQAFSTVLKGRDLGPGRQAC